MKFKNLDILTLRHAEVSEKKRLFCLIGEYFADPELRRQFGRPMSSTPEYTWLVAMDGENVAGFAGLHINASKNAELVHSYTLPSYRGQGFNEWAIEARCELARAQGAKRVAVTIDPARALKYKRHGFEWSINKGRWAVYWRKFA